MIAFGTSCGRYDLLLKTISSLLLNQQEELKVIIHEDHPTAEKKDGIFDLWVTTAFTKGVGQHKSIEQFIREFSRVEYYLHFEDDWEFKNTYNWIAASMEIMKLHPDVIKVLARDGSPHPCDHDYQLSNGVRYGFLQPWENEGIRWKGFSWNPGVTRLSALKQFVPFPRFEHELAEMIDKEEFKIVELSLPVYTHIGDGRSTH